MKSSISPGSAKPPDGTGARSPDCDRILRPEPWWSSLLGEWVDEPTQPLPLVDHPASAPAAEVRGRGGW
jgi:hypothetical protein